MTSQRVVTAGSGLGQGSDWSTALETALHTALGPLQGAAPDLMFVFASAAFSAAYGPMLRSALERSHAHALVGCSGSGIIGVDRELEYDAGIAVLALSCGDGTTIDVVRVEPEGVAEGDPGSWVRSPTGCTGLVVMADPFSTDILKLIGGLERGYPGVPVVGGLASGSPASRQTHVFRQEQAYPDGAVVVAFSGELGVRPLVSQGCQPIGSPWTITDAQDHIVRTIGNRPAYSVLVETLQQLEPLERERAASNLLVGLAMNEYRDHYARGDFLIRNLMGADPASGALAVAADLHVGQTLQFQIRDARAADDELRQMLLTASPAVDPSSTAALLFACNGRGVGLFGTPDHDVQVTREVLGSVPVAGLFCNGEIGPVDGTTFLHGFTASLGLITRVGPRTLAR